MAKKSGRHGPSGRLPLLSATECVAGKKKEQKKKSHPKKHPKKKKKSKTPLSDSTTTRESSTMAPGRNGRTSGKGKKGGPPPTRGLSVTMIQQSSSKTFSEKGEEPNGRASAPLLQLLSPGLSGVKDSFQAALSSYNSEGRGSSNAFSASPILLPSGSNHAWKKDAEVARGGVGEENTTSPLSGAAGGVAVRNSGGGGGGGLSTFSHSTHLLPHSNTPCADSSSTFSPHDWSGGMPKRSLRSGKLFPFSEGTGSQGGSSPGVPPDRFATRNLDASTTSLGPLTQYRGSISASVKRSPFVAPAILPRGPASPLLLTVVNNVAMKREVPAPDIPPEVIVAFDEYIRGKTTMWEFREKGNPHARECEVKFINMYEVQDELVPDIAFGWGKGSTGVQEDRRAAVTKGEYFLLSDLVGVSARGKKHPFVQRFRLPIERKAAKRKKKEEKNMLKWNKKRLANEKRNESANAARNGRSFRFLSLESEKRSTPPLQSHIRDEECLLQYKTLLGTHTLKDDCMFCLTFQENEELDNTDDEGEKTDVVLKAPNVVLYLSWLVFMDFISSIGFEDNE